MARSTRSAGEGHLSVRHGAYYSRGREGLDQVLLAQVHCRKTLQPGLEQAVVNLLRVELHLDPFLDANCLHPFQITRTRAEGEAIERVRGPFFFCELATADARLLCQPGLAAATNLAGSCSRDRMRQPANTRENPGSKSEE